jgi:hypothetical protein
LLFVLQLLLQNDSASTFRLHTYSQISWTTCTLCYLPEIQGVLRQFFTA